VKILIAYDGSVASEQAIDDLPRAGFPRDCEARVITVADVFASPGDSDDASDSPSLLGAMQRAKEAALLVSDGARALAETAARRILSVFPDWTVSAESRVGTPHWEIVEKAWDWQADLIVIGSRGRSALPRVLLGSVSQQVLHNARCSVRIARYEDRELQPREQRVRILLGIDGSSDSALAASAVAARHWPAGSEVLVTGVLDSRAILGQMEAGMLDRVPSPSRSSLIMEETLASVCEELRHAGLTSTPHVVVGDAKHVLLQEADRFAADCIVVGAKGHSRLERVLLGSVSASLAARARCSVEVVRSGA
jgi:nucleotide-binding universal stress UspA family protein